jgi:thioredoxin reductase
MHLYRGLFCGFVRNNATINRVLAAGDVRHRSVKRVASAVGEGASAIQEVHRYLATF